MMPENAAAAGSALEIYDRITRHDPVLPPGPLGKVIAVALDKNPDRRYPGAAEFADELGRYLRGEAVTAAELSRRLRRRMPAIALALAGLAAVIAIGVWTTRVRPTATPPGNSTADQIAAWRAAEDAESRALAATPDSIAHLLARSDVRDQRADFARLHGGNPFPDYDAAEHDLTAALALAPSSSDVLLRRGRLRAQRVAYKVKYGLDPATDFAGAEADLTAAGTPGARVWLANVHFHRGIWRSRSGDRSAAEAAFAAAERELTPAGNADALMRRGRVRAWLGRFAEAEADFVESLRLAPGNPWAWTWRGMARMQTGDAGAAEAHFTHAIVASPDHTEAWEQRGHARFALGRWSAAVTDFERALVLDPALDPLLSARLREARTRRP